MGQWDGAYWKNRAEDTDNEGLVSFIVSVYVVVLVSAAVSMSVVILVVIVVVVFIFLLGESQQPTAFLLGTLGESLTMLKGNCHRNFSLSYLVVLWLLITMVLFVFLCDDWKWVKT